MKNLEIKQSFLPPGQEESSLTVTSSKTDLNSALLDKLDDLNQENEHKPICKLDFIFGTQIEVILGPIPSNFILIKGSRQKKNCIF